MEKLVKKAYTRVQAPRQYRADLLGVLIGGDILAIKGDSIWRKPGFWVLVAAIIIVAVLIYGFWLPNHTTL